MLSRVAVTCLLLTASFAVAAAEKPTPPSDFDSSQYSGQARRWLQRARRGEASAEFQLGLALEHGQGAPQNYALARDWYSKASGYGSREAAQRIELMAQGR